MAAEGASSGRKKRAATPPPELLLDQPLGADRSDPLPMPIELPSAMFTGPGLLTLADLVPVMTAYVDRTLHYRFINKPLAEWLERPRKDMIGRHMSEVIGKKAFAER